MTSLSWQTISKAVNDSLKERGYKHRCTPVIVAQVMVEGFRIAKAEGTEDLNTCHQNALQG